MATPPDIDWVQLRIDMEESEPEDFRTKFKRKMIQNPLVPIGVIATTAALFTGLGYLRQGNSMMQQYMMRTRVSAQGFTVAVALLGTMSATLSSHLEDAANFAKKYTGIGTVSDDSPGKVQGEDKSKVQGEDKSKVQVENKSKVQVENKAKVEVKKSEDKKDAK